MAQWINSRAYMGEVLAQVWLEMSELFNKELNAQKDFEKMFPGFTQAPASPRKSVR